jgi:hypothetical protein
MFAQTNITTKYNLPHPKKAVSTRRRKAPAEDGAVDADSQPRTATLEMRTYNPEAGVVLKYSTTKGWEVGRLMASLGRLGRHQAALPEVVEDTAMLDVKEEVASGTHTPVPDAAAAGEKSKPTVLESKGGQGGGGGKKKKKGKR